MPDDSKPELKDTPTPSLPSSDQGEGLVKVRITKFGDGQVSTGEHVTGKGDVFAKRDAILEVAPAVAESLEVRGFAEIV